MNNNRLPGFTTLTELLPTMREIFLLIALCFCTSGFKNVRAQGERVAFHLNVFGNQLYSDPSEASLAGGGELEIQLKLSDHFSLVGGGGYQQFTGVISKDDFESFAFRATIKAQANFRPNDTFNPYLQAGYGKLKFDLKNADGNPLPGRTTSTVVDWAELFALGVGTEFDFDKAISFIIQGDIIFTSTDDLDNYSSGANDGWFELKFGIRYHLGRKSFQGTGAEVKPGVYAEVPLPEVSAEEIPDLDLAGILRDAEFLGGTPVELQPDPGNVIDPAIQPAQPVQYADDVVRLLHELKEDLQEIKSLIIQGNTAGAVSNSNIGIDRRYQEGLNFFEARRYSNAIAVFGELLEQYPNNNLSSNFLYWLGESHYAQGNYVAALLSFQQVSDQPNRNKDDDAQLKIGYTYNMMGRYEDARRAFQKLISQYPNSEYYRIAVSKLERLN